MNLTGVTVHIGGRPHGPADQIRLEVWSDPSNGNSYPIILVRNDRFGMHKVMTTDELRILGQKAIGLAESLEENAAKDAANLLAKLAAKKDDEE